MSFSPIGISMKVGDVVKLKTLKTLLKEFEQNEYSELIMDTVDVSIEHIKKTEQYDSLSVKRDELYEQEKESAYEEAFNVECEQRDVGGEIAYMVLNYGKEETK